MTVRKRIAALLPPAVRTHLVATSAKRMCYLHSLMEEPVDGLGVLIESRHGEAFEGNMFYLAQALLTEPSYTGYSLYVPAKPEHRATIAEQIACLPDPERVRLLPYNSEPYFHALATCKYLFNDTSFLHCFYKRPDQVYLNTWHGTPLKHLGRFVPDENVRMGNVQRNLLCADYLLNPNRFTADALFDCYMMRGQFKGTSFLMGYPRNAPLQDFRVRDAVRRHYGFDGKRVYAFMPTYRGLNGAISPGYAALTRRHLERFDELCESDELVLFNPHPFMQDAVDCDGLAHVRPFPADRPSYDVLSACDSLVTDYSSVCFDYLCTQRPIVLFTHDAAEYASRDRGFYFDIEHMGFPCGRTPEQVMDLLRSYPERALERLRATFSAYESPDSPRLVLDYVIGGHGTLQRYLPPDEDPREKVLVDVSAIDPHTARQAVVRACADPKLDKAHYYLTFPRDKEGATAIVDDIGTDADYFAIGGSALLSDVERRALHHPGPAAASSDVRHAGTALNREWQRRFGRAAFSRIVVIGSCDSLSQALYLHSSVVVDFTGGIVPYAHGGHRLPVGRRSVNCALSDTHALNGARLRRLSVGDRRIAIVAELPKRQVDGPVSAVLSLQNRVLDLAYPLPTATETRGDTVRVRIEFDPGSLALREVYWNLTLLIGEGTGRHTMPVVVSKTQLAGLCAGNLQCRIGSDVFFPFVKRGMKLAFTYRPFYPGIDTMAIRAKELAALAAYVMLRPYWQQRRIWLVFEKFCARAQDNGYYFFRYCMEQLPESERGRIFFVLDPDSPDRGRVEPWAANVVPFMGVRHMVYALAAEMYVGSDSTAHLYAWRSKPSIIRFLIGRKPMYFLQHGVMALKRTDDVFGAEGSNRMTYFTTSSEREQLIIVENFGYRPECVPVTGLPRWDALPAQPEAQGGLILLMPTWRAWLEEVDDDTFKDSEFYRVYAHLLSSSLLAEVLERLDAQLVLCLHPKFAAHAKLFGAPGNRIRVVSEQDGPLNSVIRDARMLITDYSSACWDMLYQQKPVLFYQFDRDWYEKATGSYLDLDTELPGPSFRTEEDLIRGIERCAQSGYVLDERFWQRARMWFRYRDSHNAQRSYIFLSKRLDNPTEGE